MTEQNFKNSFTQEFCQYLEYHLSNAFSNSEDDLLNRYWCDGVSHAPYFNPKVNQDYLSYENVSERGFIKTSAWMGLDGQCQYEMIITLGSESLTIYKEGESLEDCLPSSNTMDWINIDIQNKTIEVKLK